MYVTYGSVDSAKALHSFDHRLKEHPKFFCLRGRLDPGESFARFDIEPGIFPHGLVKITLENLTFCNDENVATRHGAYHFRPLPEVEMPDVANYQPEIEIRVPRPVPLVHRRRTVYFVNNPEPESCKKKCPLSKPPKGVRYPGDYPPDPFKNLELLFGGSASNTDDDDDDDDDEGIFQTDQPRRAKRTLTEEEEGAAAAAAASPSPPPQEGATPAKKAKTTISPYRVQISSSFGFKNAAAKEDFLFREATLSYFALKVSAAIKKCGERFSNLFKELPTVVTIPAAAPAEDEGGRAVTKERLKIVLPPQTMLTLENPELFDMLGFSEDYRLFKLDPSQAGGAAYAIFENHNPSTAREIIGKEAFRNSARFTTMVQDFATKNPKKSVLATLKKIVDVQDKMVVVFGPANSRLHFYLNHQSDSMEAEFPAPLQINDTTTIVSIWLTELGKTFGFTNAWFRIKKSLEENQIILMPSFALKKSLSFPFNITISLQPKMAYLLGFTQDPNNTGWKKTLTFSFESKKIEIDYFANGMEASPEAIATSRSSLSSYGQKFYQDILTSHPVLLHRANLTEESKIERLSLYNETVAAGSSAPTPVPSRPTTPQVPTSATVLEAEKEAEKKRLQKEEEAEKEKKRVEAEKKEQAEKEKKRLEAEEAEKERKRVEAAKAEQAEKERTRLEAEEAEKKRKRVEAENAELAEKQRKRVEAEKAEKEKKRIEAEEAEKEKKRVEAEEAEKEKKRVEAEEAEKEKKRVEAEKAEKEKKRAEAEEAEKEKKRVEAEKAEKEKKRVEAEQAEKEKKRVEAEKEKKRVEAEQAEKERKRVEAEKAEKEKKRIEAEAEAEKEKERQRVESEKPKKKPATSPPPPPAPPRPQQAPTPPLAPIPEGGEEEEEIKRKAQEEAEKAAKAKAEAQAKEIAEAQAKVIAELKARMEEREKAKEQAEIIAREEERAKAKEEAIAKTLADYNKKIAEEQKKLAKEFEEQRKSRINDKVIKTLRKIETNYRQFHKFRKRFRAVNDEGPPGQRKGPSTLPKAFLLNLIKFRVLAHRRRELIKRLESKDFYDMDRGAEAADDDVTEEQLDDEEELQLTEEILSELELQKRWEELTAEFQLYDDWYEEDLNTPPEEVDQEVRFKNRERWRELREQKDDLEHYRKHIQEFSDNFFFNNPDLYALDLPELPDPHMPPWEEEDVVIGEEEEEEMDVDQPAGGGAADVNVDPADEETSRQQAENIEASNDPYMTIRIPNPVPRPVQTFPEIQANYRSLCGTAPANFPLDSYVLVKETMALDWFFERGFVSLGGMLTRQPDSRIINFKKHNSVFLKSYNVLESLNLEFVDSSFATYKIQPGRQPAFLSLLISATKIV